MPTTGDFAELKALQRLLPRLGGEGRRRVSKQLALEAKDLVSEGFARGVSPAGVAWPPVRRGGQPLRDTGRLAASIMAQDNGKGFVLSTNVAYADVHQRGAVITVKKARSLYSPKLRQFFGKSVTIPARPFFPEGDSLPAAWTVRLDEAAQDALDAFFG